MADAHFTVFYAWQSDSPARVNRYFVESAAAAAVKKIKNEGIIDVSPRLDKETKGVPGIPDIADSILDKIRTVDAFLANITFIGGSLPTAGSQSEPIPNPNVMIELGYALAELGPERILYVLNTHLGTEEQLPFDLRNRRWPIAYTLSPEAEENTRADKNAKLVLRLKDAIEAIAILPPREKQRTIAQRIDALESMVATLSSHVAQYTTLANLIGGLQHHVQAKPGSREIAQDRLSALIERVRSGGFEGVSPPQGTLVLTVAHVISPATPLDIYGTHKEHTLSLNLRPLFSAVWTHKRYGDRFITESGRKEDVSAVTEITLQGTINAVGNEAISPGRGYFSPSAQEDVAYIPSIAFERNIIESVQKYVQLLADFGADGPWLLAFGMIDLGKSFLHVSSHLAFGGRIHKGGDILPPTVEIPKDTDLQNPQSIAKTLRPIFDHIWREYDYPASLNYGQSGEWIGQ